MRVTVKKWGNSASVRIPAAVMEAAHFSLDEIVDIREENGKVIIEPIRVHQYHLQNLLDGISKENLHDEMDFGDPLGSQAF